MDAIAIDFTPEFKQLLAVFKEVHSPILDQAMSTPEIYATHKKGFDALKSGKLCLFDFEQLPASGAGNIVLCGVFSRRYLEFFTAVRAIVGVRH